MADAPAPRGDVRELTGSRQAQAVHVEDYPSPVETRIKVIDDASDVAGNITDVVNTGDLTTFTFSDVPEYRSYRISFLIDAGDSPASNISFVGYTLNAPDAITAAARLTVDESDNDNGGRYMHRLGIIEGSVDEALTRIDLTAFHGNTSAILSKDTVMVEVW